LDLLGVESVSTETAGRWATDEAGRVRPRRPRRRGRAAHGHGRRYAERIIRPPLNAACVEASDESLLERLRAGDVPAGQTLVERYHVPLLRYLQRTAGPRFAEDLHQQTWLSILGHLDRFVPSAEGGGSFRGWLFRIATNKTKDHWRSLSREKAAKDGLARIGAGDTSPWSGHAADAAEQQDKLRLAIEQLPEGQRTVLMLRYYSNLKFVDIAKLLGCPVNTALTRAHKGLLKLRVSMGQEAPQSAR
jgi:RNA polymerase sigma-70 factor (ECF subfamily)